MSTSLPKTNSELMAQLRQARIVLEQTLNPLSDEQMTVLKDRVGWAIKDHLVHLIAWEQGIGALLQRRPRYAAMGLDLATVQTKSEDELNEIIRRQYEARSLSEVRAALRQSHEELLVALNSLSDADLFKTYSYYQPDEPGEDSGRPIINWVVGNSSGHYFEHLPWIQAIAAQR